ncbi:hypothetical protein HYY74_04205 [Candidatus Woesearchaeota archaeon]|nr:hypothetical protein [Candidatus Woesearchaeota archaeon]
MVVVYRGTVESIARDLDENGPRLQRAYEETLGLGYARTLQSAANRLLVPEAFFDDPKAFNALTASTELRTESTSPSRFHVALIVKAKNGGLASKIRSAPAFYVSHGSFSHSGTSRVTNRIAASYLHEFNHFAYYALQGVPIEAFAPFINPERVTLDTLPDFIMQREMAGHSHEEVLELARSNVLGALIHDLYEKATRVLDSCILGYIGISTALEWRHQPREMLVFEGVKGRYLFPSPLGDPFRVEDDRELIQQFIQWQQFVRPNIMGVRAENRDFNRLIELTGKCKFSRVPLPELLK